MTLAIIASGAGYALLYWAHPGTPGFRQRPRHRIAGVLGFVLIGLSVFRAAVFGGAIVGPIIVLTVAMVVASILVLTAPMVRWPRGGYRAERDGGGEA